MGKYCLIWENALEENFHIVDSKSEPSAQVLGEKMVGSGGESKELVGIIDLKDVKWFTVSGNTVTKTTYKKVPV